MDDEGQKPQAVRSFPMKIQSLDPRVFSLLTIFFCSGLQAEDSTVPHQTTGEPTARSEAHLVPSGLVEDAPKIHPGDNLDVWVVEDHSFNGKYSVRRGGYIIMPQVGRINVVGLTTKQAETAVKKALEDGRQVSKATVLIESSAEPVEEKKVKEAQANVMRVTGNVKRESEFDAIPGLMAYGLIQKSGGFSHFADPKKVYIVPTLPDENKTKIPVDISGIIAGSAKDVPLQSGDVVVVPEMFFSF